MRFSRDRRGQSVVIGTVVLFGFLIIALSLYQIQVVPQQNGQAEFEHYEEVQNDLVELRTAISAAGQSERAQFVDVKLGTSYQTRTFTINPPDPAGTLRTSDAYNITITDDSGTTVNVSTRFIEYRPRYNEIASGSTWYDNSVLYVAEADSNRPAVIVEDQNILVDNDTLRLTAVQNEFSASGTRKVSVELYPTSDATDLSNLSGGLDVRIPTRLGGEDGYWNESIENGSVTYQGMDDTAYPNSSEVSALLLRVDSPDNISVNSVGVQREPTGETAKDNIGPAGGGGGAGDGGDGGGPAQTPGFSSVEASNLPKNDGPSDQTLTFTVNSTLPSGESVTIDLSAAQQGEFGYGSSSVNLIGGSQTKGSVQFTTQDSNAAVVRYTANQDISPGEQIQLEATSVAYSNGNKAEYSVTFTRSDGSSATDTFSDG